MNQPQPELDRLLGELRDGPVLLSDGEETEALRARLLPGLRAQVRATPILRRRERRIRSFLGSVVVGASGLLLWMAWPEAAPREGLVLTPLGAGGFVQRGQAAQVALDTAVALEARGELAVSESASLTTPVGVQVGLDARTRVGLDQLLNEQGHSRLRLVVGKVSCNVPPLGSGSFSVITRDTEVLVHGTRFTVEVSDPEQPQTCVRVTEGLVEVRREGQHAFLHPGSSFGCEPPVESPEPASAEPAPAPREQEEEQIKRAARPASPRLVAAPTPAPEPEVSESTGSADPPVGTLAEETRLLSLALSAEQRGARARARELYTRIVRDYPASPLAPEAHRGLERVK